MHRTVLISALLVAGLGAFSAAAQAEQQAVMRVRVVTATNEGREQPIPETLTDLSYILKKMRYKQYNLVQDRAYKLAQGMQATHNVTPKADRLEIKVLEIVEGGVSLEVALLRWDEDDEEYKIAKKMVVRIANRGSYCLRDDRIRINELDTFIFLTYADRLDDRQR